MKVGNTYGFKGREFSIALALLLFTAILLWTWEKNPLITTLQSAKEQFMMSFPGHFVQAPSSPSRPMKAKEQKKVRQSSSFGSEMEKMVQAVDSTPEKSSAVPPKVKDHQNGTNSTPKNVCNFAKGRWVSDSRRPLYSGSECKQWLSGMWSCRLNHRIDFSFEGYRWQPENCEIPDFNRSEFLKRMQDKTIAFVGDSLGRQQFQSLMCMVTGGEDSPEIENVGWAYGLVKARGAIRPDGWAYRFPRTNTTILYYWSASLSDLQPLNVSDPITDVAMHLDRPPTFLSRYLQNFDVLVLNTGHHWNRGKIKGNRWVMHVNGKPVEEDDQLSDVGNAKNFTVHSITRWVNSQLALHPRLTVFFRTISPRHFLNGDWNTGGSCDNTIPLLSGSEVLQEGSSDPVIEAAIKGTKVKLLDITAISQLRDEGHVSRYSIRPVEGMQDCLHWCLPGIPDTWNEILCAQV